MRVDLIITSKRVAWAKQGCCTLVDNEPEPPTAPSFASAKGWKEVTGFTAVEGGGNFLFPRDQLMVVLDKGGYKPIESDDKRQLSSLQPTKNYLVWYHHLLPTKE